VTSPASTRCTMPYRPELTWRFHWVGKQGPAIKIFLEREAFVGYVKEVQRLCGQSCVEWRTPFLAVGVLA
jgi:hypothetical protein